MAGKNGSGNSRNTGGSKSAKNKRRRAKRAANVKALASLASDSLGNNATRTGQSPNPADPRTHTALVQLGNTPHGRNAAVKALHPCGEASTFVTKWPDGAATTSVVMERRDEYKVPAPDATNNWNCLMYNLPFLVGRQVVLRWPNTVTPTRDELEFCIAAIISIETDNGADSKHVYPEFQENIGGFSVSGSLLVPSVLGDKRTPDDFEALFRSVRRTAFGITTDLDASDLYNEGRVVSGQWNADVTLATTQLRDADGNTEGTPVDVYRWQCPPLTVSNVVASDEYSRQAEAKTGSYMPIRTFQSAVLFTPSGQARPLQVVRAGDTESVESTATSDLFLDGWAVGVTYWTDLDPHASLRVKVRECVELVPSGESVFSPFATPGYPDDPRACQMIKEYSRTQPHDFPADYNELGTMLQNLVTGVGSALSNLGIPVISDIAKGATGLVSGPLGSGLANLLNGLL